MGGIPLEVLARFLVGDGLPVPLQLGQVHVKGGPSIGEVCVQGHHPQGRLRSPRCLLLAKMYALW